MVKPGLDNPFANNQKFLKNRAAVNSALARRKRKSFEDDVEAVDASSFVAVAETHDGMITELKDCAEEGKADGTGHCLASCVALVGVAMSGATFNRDDVAGNKERERLAVQLDTLGSVETPEVIATMSVMFEKGPFQKEFADECQVEGTVRAAAERTLAIGPDPCLLAKKCKCKGATGYNAHSSLFAGCTQRHKAGMTKLKALTEAKAVQAQKLSRLATRGANVIDEAGAARAQASMDSRLGLMAARKARVAAVSADKVQSTLQLSAARQGSTDHPRAEVGDGDVRRAVDRELERLRLKQQNVTAPAKRGEHRFATKEPRANMESAEARPALLDHLRDFNASAAHEPLRHWQPRLPAVRTVAGVRTPQRPHTVDDTRTMIVNYNHPAVLEQLRTRGRDCVPCHRVGCRSETVLLKGSNACTLRRAPCVVLGASGTHSHLMSAWSSCAT